MTRNIAALVGGGLAVPTTFYGWLAAASYIYCSGSGNPQLFMFPFDQWLQVAPYLQYNWWIGLWIVVSAAAPPGLIALAVFAWFRRTQGRRLRRPLFQRLKPIEEGVTDNHGHAYWPTVDDMLRRHSGPSREHGGVVIGEARRIDLEPVKDVPFDNIKPQTWGLGGKAPLLINDCTSASPHSVMFIGTGGYKSMAAISTQFHWRGSIITFDPSCEIGPMVRRWREKLGQRVVFIGKNPGQVGIAALDCIKPGTPDAESRILSMVASICGEETGRNSNDKNSVFESAGRNLIAALLSHMMYDKTIPDHLKNMETLVEMITIPEDKMQEFLRHIHKSSDSLQARKLAGIAMGTHRETFSGAYFNATQYAGWLLDAANARMLSGGIKPSEILNGDLSIYIQIPTGTLMYVPGLGRVITDSIVSSIIQAKGAYAEQMLLQVDEARLLGPMKSLEVVLLQGRKYGLSINMIYTSVNDMRRVWLEDGLETWLDNVGWAGYAAVASMKTAEALSKAVGKRGVMAISEGSNQGTSGQGLGMGSRSRGSNTSEHEISRPLILPEEFKDARTDELFVFPRSGRPFRCGLAPYFRRQEMVREIDQTTFLRNAA